MRAVASTRSTTTAGSGGVPCGVLGGSPRRTRCGETQAAFVAGAEVVALQRQRRSPILPLARGAGWGGSGRHDADSLAQGRARRNCRSSWGSLRDAPCTMCRSRWGF